ncbi:MAG: hypothetical protein HOW73_14905 [Polyangiaceae bacterium]|nr:hypothetical protein [Polyangiaceae bacterium]
MNGRSQTGLWAVLLAGLVGCASDSGPAKTAAEAPPGEATPTTAGASDGMSVSARERAASAEARPGLGTTWGESRTSHITNSPFQRADSASPFASSSVFYNDEAGAKQMATMSGVKDFSEGSVAIGGGIATLRLKDGAGRFLNGFEANGKHFVVGTEGDRYSIVIQSNVPARIEVVVSVDGLDVLDGKEASFTKRGYLIDPHSMIEIDGFRQSMDSVAAFRFGAVKESYAQKKHSDTRNVGVIGVALFNEQGTNPQSWPIGDASQRLNADPFPGRFATPPAN